MVPFAVWHEGLAEGAGKWVLEVDTNNDRLLLSDDEGRLYWQLIADCKLINARTPDMPVMMAVQPNQPKVVVPGNFPNREMRRNGF